LTFGKRFFFSLFYSLANCKLCFYSLASCIFLGALCCADFAASMGSLQLWVGSSTAGRIICWRYLAADPISSTNPGVPRRRVLNPERFAACQARAPQCYLFIYLSFFPDVCHNGIQGCWVVMERHGMAWEEVQYIPLYKWNHAESLASTRN
jgi:hypothetical protein